MKEAAAMLAYEAWLAAGLLMILSLIERNITIAPSGFIFSNSVKVRLQKEVDIIEINNKKQRMKEKKISNGFHSRTEDGLPDRSPGNFISPLAAEAIALARSKSKADQMQLGKLLIDKGWLDRLDPPTVAQGIDPRFLQLTSVLKVAAKEAPRTIEVSAGHPLYRQPGWRQAALIEASGALSKPGPKLIKLWRSQLKPQADELETTIRALVQNQSPPALSLLEEAFSSSAFSDELVISWFRDPVLQHRQDLKLLTSLERMLKAGRLTAKRKASLVEVIFDYRPLDWYISTDKPPIPPRRSELTEAARRRLRSIADMAAKERLIDQGRRAEIETELLPPNPKSYSP